MHNPAPIDSRAVWRTLRPILARTQAVFHGVAPGAKVPIALRAFRSFLTGPRADVERLLFEALDDPAPIVAGWALSGLMELQGSLQQPLPPSIFAREEVIVEQLGTWKWRGTLGESAREVQRAFDALA